MIETILIAFLIARIRGYKVSPAFRDWSLWPMFALSIVYIFLEISIFAENAFFLPYSRVFEFMYLATVAVPMCRHKIYIQGIIGAGFVILGSILNRIVMSANDGKMPVYPSFSNLTGYSKLLYKINDGIHLVGNSETKLKILTDWIDIGYCVLSIGDIFIHCYTGIVIYYTIITCITCRGK